MTHDPLCPWKPQVIGHGSTAGDSQPAAPAVACQCPLIERVRTDEAADCASHEKAAVAAARKLTQYAEAMALLVDRDEAYYIGVRDCITQVSIMSGSSVDDDLLRRVDVESTLGLLLEEDPLLEEKPEDGGIWVLAADAEAHFKEAINQAFDDGFKAGEAVMLSDFDESAKRKTREQAIRDCIAAVEIGHPRGVRWWADWLFWSKFRRRLVTYGYDWHKRDAVKVLRALLDKP